MEFKINSGDSKFGGYKLSYGNNPKPLSYQPLHRLQLTNSPSMTNRASIPIKWLTVVEMAEQREKGFCFNCDKKFHRNYVCKNKLFVLMLVNDKEDVKM